MAVGPLALYLVKHGLELCCISVGLQQLCLKAVLLLLSFALLLLSISQTLRTGRPESKMRPNLADSLLQRISKPMLQPKSLAI